MAKRERPGINPTISSSKTIEDTAAVQEALIAKLNREDKVITKKVKQPKIRFTMDLPKDLHQAITGKADDNGQTMKGYILKLVKKDLAEG